MSVLLFLILAAATGWLGYRVRRLEAEVARLRLASRAAEPATEPPRAAETQPVAPAPSAIAPQAPSAEPFTRTPRWRPAFDVEDLFGRLLPIWAGGVTLAVAGFFLVRWSIDAGLLTPRVRVALAGLFGLLLLAGAEAAYRWRERVADPRVAQALAGAGLATLYAAFYLAGTGYGLIGSTVAFLGLAAVTAAAIGLSYRFGLPSAVLGLVGGFAAPALVGSTDANLPLLTLYLALVTAGLSMTGRRQDRAWLGIAALVAGLGWGAVLTGQGALTLSDVAVVGVYVVLLGAVIPAYAAGHAADADRPIRVGAAALAAVQLALLVAGRFGALEWALYLLLGAALAWFGWRQPAAREGSAFAAAVGMALLGAWGEPDPQRFAVVSALALAIFAGAPLAQIGRAHRRALDLAQAAGVALAVAAAALWHFGTIFPPAPQPLMALVLLALATVPAAGLLLVRRTGAAFHQGALWGAQAVAALLGFAAASQVLPQQALAWTAAAGAAVIAWRSRSLLAAVAMLALIAAAWAADPLAKWVQAGGLALVGAPMQAADLPGARAVLLYLAPAALGAAACAAVFAPGAPLRRIYGGAAVALGAIAGHILYRQAFASAAGTDFAATGLAERTLWEALLLAAAWGMLIRGWRTVAVALALASAAHFGWFSLVLHNPLWSPHAVGSLPLINLLLPAYGVAAAALLALRRWNVGTSAVARWLIDGGLMALVALFALSELRQAFAGSRLTSAPVEQTEDLLRSLLGIVLAVGFLAWGSRANERSWRIGSLVLMLVAVLKVFLVDAAGLAGLARIASFMALGFSLIGIGWFYARQLRAPAVAQP